MEIFMGQIVTLWVIRLMIQILDILDLLSP
jgi:hypothetical protein